MRQPLNLARWPFRNETLPAALFALAAVAVVLGSLAHARVLRRLVAGSASTLKREVGALEADQAVVAATLATLRPQRLEPRTLAQWVLLKELVDRRTFSWTDLLSRLEALQPPGVKLISIAPGVSKGVLRLQVVAMTRSQAAGLDFVRVLEESPEFADVYPLTVNPRENQSGSEVEYRYTMRYLPPGERASSGAVGSAQAATPAPDGAIEAEPEEVPPPEETEPGAPGAGGES